MFRLFRKKRPKCTALVPAAGSAQRMNGVSKLFRPLCGVPVLVRTLASLQLSRRVDEIIVAAREQDIEEVSRLCKEYAVTKCKKVIVGGATREASVMRAAMEASRDTRLLAVHDGARPLVTPGLIDRTVEAAARYGAVAPALPLKDTVKRIKEGGEVDRTLKREALRAVQTPQVFDADLLKASLHAAFEAGAELTDDCSAVERLGKVVFLIDGEEENLKITTPVDMIFAEAVLRKRMGSV